MAAFPFIEAAGVCPHCGHGDRIAQLDDERRTCGHCGARWLGRRDHRTDGPLGISPLSPIAGTAVAAPAARSRAAAMLAAFESHPNALARDAHPGLWETLLREEYDEIFEALESGDRSKIARELADVVYVAYGIAHVCAIDLDVALEEIHRAAMDKIRAGLRRGDGKIIKPPGFVPPDMTEAVLGASARRAA